MEHIELIAEQKYTIELSGAELHYLINCITEKPYKEVEPIISNITNQLKQKDNG